MRIILTGPKGVGKSTAGGILSGLLGLPVVETDRIIEDEYERVCGVRHPCRDICKIEGESSFRARESRAAALAAGQMRCILCTGSATMLDLESRRILRRDSLVVYLRGEPELLWSRVEANGIPPFLEGEKDPRAAFIARVEKVNDVVLPYADILVDVGADDAPETVAEQIRDRIAEEMVLYSGRFSTLGTVLQVHTFGESHGRAMGAVIDGVPSGLTFSEQDIQCELDRRRPGQSRITTARSEADRVRILSGVFQGQTTGAPIALVIDNHDQRSGDYEAFKYLFRPGHADFTFWAKYGIRDYRGGGRSSGRETSARVAAGAMAKRVLADRGIQIRAYTLEIAGIRARQIDYSVIESNPVRCPDPKAAVEMEAAILAAREAKDSVGGIIQIEIEGVPPGLGDPVFGKLDARLGGALLSVGAVKGVEFGSGFAAARMCGSQHNDAMHDGRFTTNHAGGILGGISNGETIVARVVMKPTASIASSQKTCDIQEKNQTIAIEGRHDPCIVPRAVVVMESMAALVILDCILIQDRLRR